MVTQIVEVMFGIGFKQGCHLSPTLVVMYIDALKTYFDKINGVSLCLLNTMVAIHLSVDDVVLLSQS